MTRADESNKHPVLEGWWEHRRGSWGTHPEAGRTVCFRFHLGPEGSRRHAWKIRASTSLQWEFFPLLHMWTVWLLFFLSSSLSLALRALTHWSSKSLKLPQSFEQGTISGELPLSAFPGVMALSNASLGPGETCLRGLPALEEEAYSRCLSSNSLGVCAANHRGPDTGSSPAPSSAS